MAEQNNFDKEPFKENPIKQMLLSTPAAGESLGLNFHDYVFFKCFFKKKYVYSLLLSSIK